MELSEKRALRFQYLRALYGATEGRTLADVEMWQVGQALGLNREQTDAIVEYLVHEGLMEYRAQGGRVGISHAGVQEVEQALAEPGAPTAHFPPVVNITNIGTMIGSQLQQGSHGSMQSQSRTVIDVRELQSFTESVRRQLPDLQLQPIQQREAEADLATLEAQAASGNPKSGIVRESLQSLQHILEHAVGHAAGAALLLPPLMHLLAAVAGK